MSDNIFESLTAKLKATGNFRTIPENRFGNGVLDFSANDYLGFGNITFRDMLVGHPELLNAPMTSSASRLLASTQSHYNDLERLLESIYGFGRRALLFNSGYHANVGMVSALGSLPGTLIVADKLVHASIIDGMKEIRNRIRFPHNNLDKLDEILAREADNYERKIVIVESVYSMDGDSPDLERLVSLKKKYPGTILYIDEAHAFGVLGSKGTGLTMQTHAPDEFDIVIATLGKAVGSYGAFAIMKEPVRNFFINKARSFIFSTSLPPQTVLWSKLMIERMLNASNERRQLRHNSEKLYMALQEIAPDRNRTVSHIGYLIIGDPSRAVGLSAKLREQGLIVLPIRTPTVPPGTERLRISLSSSHSDADIDKLISALKEWK